MKIKFPRIYNTITFQEKITLLLISLLFVAQPFDAVYKVALIILLCIGISIIVKESSIFKQLAVQQLAFVGLLLIIPGILSYWNTYNVEETTAYVGMMFGMFFVGIAIWSLFRNKKTLEILTTVIAITSFVWIFNGFIQYFFGKDLLGIPLGIGGRVVGSFTSTHMGMLLTVMIPVVLKWLGRFGGFSKLVYLASLATIILFSGVRTDWVTYLAALVLYFAWSKKDRLFLFMCILPMLVIVFWIVVANSSFSRTQANKLQMYGIPQTYQEWNNLLSKRPDIWNTGWHMFKEHPIVGIGARGFTAAYQDYRATDDYYDGSTTIKNSPLHIHHPWISVFVETGTVGFIGFIGIFLLLFGITSRSRWGIQLYSHPWLITLLLIVNPCNSMPPFYKTWLLPIVLLAFVAHLAHVEQRVLRDNVSS